ncbi:MAG: hypothetical protein IIZ45_04275 [Firmicutes bacterium]|nr:hypothetical protein [Bacillota bacterium]
MKKMLLPLICGLLLILMSGCAPVDKEAAYAEGAAAYDQARYGDAAQAFRRAGDHADAAEMKGLCAMLAEWQSAAKAEELLREYLQASADFEGEPQDVSVFLPWALATAAKKGSVEILLAAYPYFAEAAAHMGGTAPLLARELERTAPLLCGAYAAYLENPRLFAFAEKNGGLELRDGDAVFRNFSPLLEQDTDYAPFFRKLPLFVDAASVPEVKIEQFNWSRDLLKGYYQAETYAPARPRSATLLFAYEPDSEYQSSFWLEDAVADLTDELSFTVDPDEAAIYVYYDMTTALVTYTAKDGSPVTVTEGGVEFTAVDAVSGEIIAEAAERRTAPEDIMRWDDTSGSHSYLPDMQNMDGYESFRQMVEQIVACTQTQQ